MCATMSPSKSCDIAVIGAGPAGTTAAIRAGQLAKGVILAERNDSIGRKIMMTGNGRCNLTNAASMDVFIKKFKPRGEFLRTAFFRFSNEDLKELFRSKGLEMKIEENGKVFPVTDKASSVVRVLNEFLKESKVDVVYGARITDIKYADGWFLINSESATRVKSRKVILATGGASYKATGSTGDGFKMAERLGHKIVCIRPALVPLKTKEIWVKELQGLSFENVGLTAYCSGKKISSDIGEMMFTHFGITGPLVLDVSGDVISCLEHEKDVNVDIDFKPDITRDELEACLDREFSKKGGVHIDNFMQDVLPKRMAGVFLSLADIATDKRANQISKKERRVIADMLKAFPLTITGPLGLDEAMVTAGGVSMKDINPRTMESKIVPGLYFAGEIIEGSGQSGGYNLQQAFSTGYLAGENAANA